MTKSIKKAALLSYLNLGVTNIGGLLITPYIVRTLGDKEYGLYILIGSFVGYLSLLDFGLNNAIVRYVAQYRSEKNKSGEENFLALCLILYVGIGLALVAVGTIIYYNVDTLFGSTLNVDQLRKAKLMMLILILNFGFTLPGSAFTGICTGYESYVFPRSLILFKYIIRIVLIISILYLGSGAVGIVILDTSLNLILMLLTIWFVFSKLKVTIKLYKFEWLFIKEIFGYSIWIFLYGLAFQFQWLTGQVILGTHMDTVTVAVYGIGVMLGIYFTNFGSIINHLTFPMAVHNIIGHASPEILTKQMTRVGRISFMIMLYVFGGFIVVGQDFIELWLGSTYSNAWFIASGIMLAYIMPMAQGYAYGILQAKKLLKFKTLSFISSCGIGMLCGGYLSYRYGELGMIIGLILPLIVLEWGIMNLYYYKKLNLNILYFLKENLSIFAFSIIIITLLYNLFLLFEASWFALIMECITYSLVFFLGILLISNNDEKKLLGIKIHFIFLQKG